MTQADVDTRRNVMFSAYAAKRNPAGLLATVQAAADAAHADWVAATGAYRALPDTATPAQISAAEALIASTELARTAAYQQLAAVTASLPGLSLAADQAAANYANGVIALGNGA